MKKGYKKLLIYQIILCAFLFLNSFVLNILGGYNTVIFLSINLLLFKFVFGYEKDKHRYVKDVIYDILIVLLISFMLYFLFGVLIGFYKIENYLNLYGIKTFILPTILIVLLEEFFRYQMLNKSEGNKLLITTSIILFTFIDICSVIYYKDFSSTNNTFIFIALTLLPKISRNIACSYITVKLGYKPNLLWCLVIDLYIYLIPIIPNPNEYILSIIRFLFPLAIMWRVYTLFIKVEDHEIDRSYKKNNNLIYIFTMFLVGIIVYFTSGYFHYYALAIGSGSMNPYIKKGDIVIVENIGKNYDNIKEGQVIAFNHDNVMYVHRVVNILYKDNKYYYYTKGDANDAVDNFSIYEEEIIGIVNFKIPYIGLPTIWLSEL